MKHWTIQKLVAAGFFLVILLSGGICAFSILRLASIQSQTRGLKDDHVVGLYCIAGIQLRAQENAYHIYKLILAQSEEEKAKLIEAIETNRKENQGLIDQMAATDVSQENGSLYNAFTDSRANYLDMLNRVVSLNKSDNKAATALYRSDLAPVLDKYLAAIKDLQEHNKTHADRAADDILSAVGDTRIVALVGSVVSLLVCIGIAVSVVRQLSMALKKLMLALIQVNGSATEMSATLKQQQASANEIASTSVEIGATAKEISATTKELGKTMSDVATVSEQTALLATGGQSGLSRLEGTMRQIMGASATISAKLAILNDKTANIHSVVSTINKVADQTNLLSLNAAIEAEKAGEYGQGFSVVATEIRRLADQTAVATYDIEQMVKEMQSAVSAGVMGMDKFSEEVRRGNEEVCGVTAQLVQIIQQVQALTPRFETVNEGMQVQSTAAGQISDALTQLGETAQQSAQAVRQNSDAIEQLSLAANGLQGAVSQLKSQN